MRRISILAVALGLAFSGAAVGQPADSGIELIATSFISIDPTVVGFNFVVAERDGKRALIVREAQHEYAFLEAAPP